MLIQGIGGPDGFAGSMQWNWVTSAGVVQASFPGAGVVQAILPCANSVWKTTADENAGGFGAPVKSLSTPPVGTGIPVRGAKMCAICRKQAFALTAQVAKSVTGLPLGSKTPSVCATSAIWP